MNNSTLSFDEVYDNNWCMSLTGSVYLYGYFIPAIALFIFGLTFNPIALYYFATSLNFHRSAYSYYFSAIAVFDLLRLTIWGLFVLLDFKIFKLNFHSFECPTQVYTESVTSSVSAWLTVLLTVERCLAIYNPLQTLKDTRRKRTLVVILVVILVSCATNLAVLQPGFYVKRHYRQRTHAIVCYFQQWPYSNETNSSGHSLFSPNVKRIYLLITVILRVAIPFILLLTMNILLFISVRRTERESSKLTSSTLIRHGQLRQITPMIFFSSCILLLTVSPRYLLQFFVNFYQNSPNCILMHFAPHLLKTLELSNYAFNVFVSIISGKLGRHELFNMLLCRLIINKTSRTNNGTKLIPLSTPQSLLTSRSQRQVVHSRRSTNNTNSVNIPLISIAKDSARRSYPKTYHYRFQ